MGSLVHDDYELIAKRCPMCESLVMAKPTVMPEGIKYSDYRCSICTWTSPAGRTEASSKV